MFLAIASIKYCFFFLFFFIAVAQALCLLSQHKVSVDLQWEKWKLRFIAISLQIFWQKFYRNVPWVVLYKTYEFCPNRWIWLVVMATTRINSRKNIKKIICSEAIRGMKLKLCGIVHITESSPCAIGNFRKWLLYWCFMSLPLIVI